MAVKLRKRGSLAAMRNFRCTSAEVFSVTREIHAPQGEIAIAYYEVSSLVGGCTEVSRVMYYRTAEALAMRFPTSSTIIRVMTDGSEEKIK